MTVFIGLCALVALLCALTAAIASRRCVEAWKEASGALRAASSLRGTVEETCSDVAALRDSFRQLRGKFYAERAKRADDEIDAPPPSAADLKAKLRTQVGLVPGRRP